MFTRVEGLFMKKKKKRVSINKKVFPFMKRGFTLVELLAVLVILAVLAALSVPTYYVVSNQIKESSYETKLENILSHAESYTENTNNFAFDVGTLIEQGLLEADNEAGEYLDPRNGRDMRCDIINIIFENNQYVASVTESDTCYTDEELQNLFGMFEIVIYRPDGTKVEPIEGTDWIREQDVVLKYELKDEYKDLGYEDNITQIIWSGEEEKACEQNNLASCEGYDIHTEVIKNVTVNLQINIKINGSIVISRTNKKVLVDLESPRVDNIVTGTDLNEQEMNRTEFDLSDGNGSGVKYYAVLPSTGTCSGAEYEAARKNINGNHVVEYLDSGDYKICVEDNVGNKGEESVSLRAITFDPNGGKLEIDKKVIRTNTSYGAMPTPTREYYHFLGWFTEANGGTQVTPDTVLTEDTTVYAHWQIYTYTISYNANGGSGAPGSQIKTHGINLTLSSIKPTRSNYTFLGWSTSSSATSSTYSASATFTVNADTTLYAVWKTNTYTITYHANGGSGAPSVQSYTYSPSGTINLSSTKPTRSGYVFLGWSLSSTASSASYSSGQAWKRSNASNYVLYAVWRRNQQTITNFGLWQVSSERYGGNERGWSSTASGNQAIIFLDDAGYGGGSVLARGVYVNLSGYTKATFYFDSTGISRAGDTMLGSVVGFTGGPYSKRIQDRDVVVTLDVTNYSGGYIYLDFRGYVNANYRTDRSVSATLKKLVLS